MSSNPIAFVQTTLRTLQRSAYHIKRDLRIRYPFLAKKTILPQPIICFSHSRCATQTTGKTLETLSDYLDVNCFWGYQEPTSETLQRLLERYQILFFHRTKPGDFPAKFSGISFKGFHLYRDPRNTLISMYFSHRYSHKLDRFTSAIEKDRQVLDTLNEENGLLYLLENSEQFNDTANSLNLWDFSDPRLLQIRFEDHARNPKKTWLDIMRFVNLPFPEKRLDAILKDYSFETMRSGSLKRRGYSHYRSAQADDYLKHFTPRITRAFNQKWGNLLVKLGYQV